MLDFELRYSPRRWFWCWAGLFRNRAGLYVTWQMVLPLLATAVIALQLVSGRYELLSKFLLLLVSWVVIADCVIGNTSVAFVSRFPTNYMRTLLFALGSYLAIVLAFAANYAACSRCFVVSETLVPSLGFVQSVYFSFVTITTLGYGDIKPASDAALPQLLVILELVVGLYYIAGVVAVLSTWTNDTPKPPRPVELDRVLAETRPTSGIVV